MKDKVFNSKRDTSNFGKYRKNASIATSIIFMIVSLILVHMNSDSFNAWYIIFPLFAGAYGLMSYAYIWAGVWDETDYLTHR